MRQRSVALEKPVEVAAAIASRNGAHLTSCALDAAGTTAAVTVEVVAGHWLGPPATLTGRARAGPSSALLGVLGGVG